jgi:hypothetical protein
MRPSVLIANSASDLMKNCLLLTAAISVGLVIAYIDSRPKWDDSGVTALVLVLCSGMLGALEPVRPWRWALAVAVWIPAWGIIHEQNFGALLAVVVAIFGAYAGMAIRKLLSG